MTDKKKSIVFLGFSSFPYGLAEAQKIILISKALILKENTVTVICRNGLYSKQEKPELKAEGIYENIRYKYVSGSCFRDKRFFKRRLLELKGRVNEVLFLRKLAKENKLDYAILSTRNFSSVVLYYALAKMLKFKTILNYVEYYSAAEKNKFQIKKRINDKLFDKYAPLLSDAVFPISEFLITHLKKQPSFKPFLKIPVLTDFSRYQNIEILRNEKYFLFCGSASYKEIILFVISSFELINDSYYLYLVINGSENEMQEIQEYIKMKKKKEKIKIYTKLPQKELYTYYQNAAALLIPLRSTFQDLARFPHKTGEYLASGNPVISTDYGEVKYYFTNMVNMLLAESFDTKLFADKMEFVINNPVQAQKIGLEGQKLATKLFDYRSKAQEMNNFLNEI